MTAPDTIIRALCCIAALLCYISFIWAVMRFFTGAEQLAFRMKAISVTGIASMITHMTGLLLLTLHGGVRSGLGLLLFLTAFCLFWWALRTTWKDKLPIAFSASLPLNLIQRGPYRLVRHPIYLSYLLCWVAGAMAIPAWWPWIVPVIMGLQYLSAIAIEERQLLSGQMSKEYAAYMTSVGRIFPNPFKLIRAIN